MAVAENAGSVGTIGETAGVVWKVLATEGPLTVAKLIKQTDAPKDLVMQAIGWLAREDKLAFEEGRTKKIALK